MAKITINTQRKQKKKKKKKKQVEKNRKKMNTIKTTTHTQNKQYHLPALQPTDHEAKKYQERGT